MYYVIHYEYVHAQAQRTVTMECLFMEKTPMHHIMKWAMVKDIRYLRMYINIVSSTHTKEEFALPAHEFCLWRGMDDGGKHT